jgi:hypothetical protein
MASWCQSEREGTALAIRFDRPLEGQHTTAMWLSSSLSTQAGTKRSLKVPLHFGRGAQLALGASFSPSQVATTVLGCAHVPRLLEEDAAGTKRRVER